MFSSVVSTLALALSVTVAWLTLFRRGRVEMTRPTMVAFVQDGDGGIQKVVIRALLYCTANRGRVVETMFAVLNGPAKLTFPFWGYGETTTLQRGGGLFVGREGIAVNHHLTLMQDESGYVAGRYTLEVFATLVGETKPHRLATASLELTDKMAEMLNLKRGGIMFNLDPQTAIYVPESKSTFRPVLVA